MWTLINLILLPDSDSKLNISTTINSSSKTELSGYKVHQTATQWCHSAYSIFVERGRLWKEILGRRPMPWYYVYCLNKESRHFFDIIGDSLIETTIPSRFGSYRGGHGGQYYLRPKEEVEQRYEWLSPIRLGDVRDNLKVVWFEIGHVFDLVCNLTLFLEMCCCLEMSRAVVAGMQHSCQMMRTGWDVDGNKRPIDVDDSW